MQTIELKPTNGRKSFYGKAKIICDGKIAKLQSYETIVAEYNHKENEIFVFWWYSMTTANHINAFLQYYGFDKMGKKEMQSQKEKNNKKIFTIS